MTLTLKALQTARRNLAQRIERVLASLSAEPDAWQSLYLARAIEHLQAGRYPAGEDAAARAEQPEIWAKHGAPPPALSSAELRARLALAKEAAADHAVTV